MKNSPVKTVKPENINCKVGGFGLSLKMKSKTYGEMYHKDTKPDSMSNEILPVVLWGPECQWQGGERYFTEYSDVFTFGMLMWEFFRILGECRTDRKCCAKCQPQKIINKTCPEKFLTSRQDALPVPTLLEMENDATKDVKQRMFKCWKYQSKDNPHQKT